MDAISYLQEVRKKEAFIKNKFEQIKDLREKAQSPLGSMWGSDKVQASKNVDRLADKVGLYIDLEEKLQAEIFDSQLYKMEVIKTLEQLKVTEYDLLYKRYIDGLTVKEVAELKQSSIDSVKTAQRRAIKSLQKLLDDREK